VGVLRSEMVGNDNKNFGNENLNAAHHLSTGRVTLPDGSRLLA
jgi:hypothetical protein